MNKPVTVAPAVPDSVPPGQAEPGARADGRFPITAFRHLVFDCDGVLVDSNSVKEANIRSAALSVCEPDTADRFVRYFVGNNGLPREAKIEAFFGDPAVQEAVLNAYNRLNGATLNRLRPDAAAVDFLERCARAGVAMYVLSGGDEAEVRGFVEQAGIAGMFREILGGPMTKEEHLRRLGLEGPACYFGDSRYDFEVADRFGFHFVFMSRYTQFVGWEAFFSGKPGVEVAYDFRSFNG